MQTETLVIFVTKQITVSASLIFTVEQVLLQMHLPRTSLLFKVFVTLQNTRGNVYIHPNHLIDLF